LERHVQIIFYATTDNFETDYHKLFSHTRLIYEEFKYPF